MRRRDLEKELRHHGWELARHGAKHDVWSKGERELVVPRHVEVNEYTGEGHPPGGPGGSMMRFAGRVFRAGRYWAVEVPILDVVTQGRSKRDAFAMIVDAIETLTNRSGFKLDVYPGAGEYFEVGSKDQATLTALLLRRARQRAGLTLAQVAQRLGATSINAYARYEQGRSIPTVEKLSQLFSAVASDRDLVVVESET